MYESTERQVFVLPANAEAVRLAIAVATQWRFCPMSGVLLGLDYPALDAAARMIGIPATENVFARVQVIESEILRLDHDARAETGARGHR